MQHDKRGRTRAGSKAGAAIDKNYFCFSLRFVYVLRTAERAIKEESEPERAQELCGKAFKRERERAERGDANATRAQLNKINK